VHKFVPSVLSMHNSFVSDDTKVGQKLLEKMGWRKGKALGLKEDGCKEHVKVSTKSDRRGLLPVTELCRHSILTVLVLLLLFNRCLTDQLFLNYSNSELGWVPRSKLLRIA